MLRPLKRQFDLFEVTIGNGLFAQIGPEIAAFCAGVGTAGMLMGVSSAESARGTDEDRGP